MTNKRYFPRLFIEAGSKLNEKHGSTFSWLPLQLALWKYHYDKDLIVLLLQGGARVDSCTLQIVGRYIERNTDCDIHCGYLALIEEISADEVQEDARETFFTLC